MRIMPLKNYVLIQRIRPEERSPGGVIMVTERVRDKRCLVLATGPDCQLVFEGDTVLVPEYQGQMIDQRADTQIVAETDILARIEP